MRGEACTRQGPEMEAMTRRLLVCLLVVVCATSTPVVAQKSFTFAVFADRRCTIFDWAWIRSDPEEANLPIGWRDRFARRIWPRT